MYPTRGVQSRLCVIVRVRAALERANVVGLVCPASRESGRPGIPTLAMQVSGVIRLHSSRALFTPVILKLWVRFNVCWYAMREPGYRGPK